MDVPSLTSAVGISLAAPLAIALIVGLPVWIVTRKHETYARNLAAYRAATGQPPRNQDEGNDTTIWLCIIAYVMILSVARQFYSKADSAVFLLVAVYCLWSAGSLVWDYFKHADLEPRLRKVPLFPASLFGMAAIVTALMGSTTFI